MHRLFRVDFVDLSFMLNRQSRELARRQISGFSAISAAQRTQGHSKPAISSACPQSRQIRGSRHSSHAAPQLSNSISFRRCPAPLQQPEALLGAHLGRIRPINATVSADFHNAKTGIQTGNLGSLPALSVNQGFLGSVRRCKLSNCSQHRRPLQSARYLGRHGCALSSRHSGFPSTA